MGHFTLRRLAAVALLSVSASVARAQTGGLGIGTTTPNASAALDITSTTKGLLLPRLTQAQRDAIATPPGGLVIFQTDNTPGIYAYSGSAWVLLAADNLGNHTATQNLDLGANLLVGNGGTQGLSITSGGNVGIGTTTPTQKLHVSGNATVTSTLSIGANNTVNPLSVTGTAPITALLQSGNTIGTRVNLTNTSTGATTWSLISTGSAASEGVGKLLINDVTGPRLTLDGSGRMGVGLTNPSALLDVNGPTRLRGLTTAGVVTTDASGNLSSATAASLDATTASNGLTRTGTDVALGGTLNQNTTVALAGNSLALSNSTSQTITQAATSFTASVSNSLGMGQSFTLPAGATVTKVDVYGGGGSGAFTFYQGVPGSTALTTQPVTYNTGQALTSITLTTPVTVGAAGTYSFSTGSNNLFAVSNTNPYAGGVLYDGTTPTTTFDMKFVLYYTTPGTALYVGNSGGVGIGTSAPAATLHVAGAGSTVLLEGLSGSGTRVVTADASGNLGSAPAASLDPTTASNGLTKTGSDFALGGTLTGATTIGTTAANPLTVNGVGAVNLGTGTGATTLGNTSAATVLRGSGIVLTGPVTSANALTVSSGNLTLNSGNANISGSISAGGATITGTTQISGTTQINASGSSPSTTGIGNGQGNILVNGANVSINGTTTINSSGTAATSIGTATNGGAVTIGRAGGTITMANLTGTGTRVVTADAAGVLSTQALPTDTDAQTLSVSGGNLSISNGNSVTLASLADNLGNHTATTTLNLNGNRLSGGSGANIGIPGGQTLEFGAGVSGKEVNAGKIGYQTFGGTDLDIVGAGTTSADRRIKLWAEGGLEVSGPSYLTGNVGIGALNPTYRLQVVGGDTRLGATGGESNLFGIDKIVGLNDLRFYTDDAGTTERMQISSGGNVGIGTTNPTSTLHVTGSEAGAYVTTGSATSFTLTSAHRTVRRFGTCATITVPQASTCPGRLYTIINSNGQGAFTLTVTGGGSVYDDIANQTFSGTNAFPAATRLTIQSDGSGWIVVAR